MGVKRLPRRKKRLCLAGGSLDVPCEALSAGPDLEKARDQPRLNSQAERKPTSHCPATQPTASTPGRVVQSIPPSEEQAPHCSRLDWRSREGQLRGSATKRGTHAGVDALETSLGSRDGAGGVRSRAEVAAGVHRTAGALESRSTGRSNGGSADESASTVDDGSVASETSSAGLLKERSARDGQPLNKCTHVDVVGLADRAGEALGSAVGDGVDGLRVVGVLPLQGLAVAAGAVV